MSGFSTSWTWDKYFDNVNTSYLFDELPRPPSLLHWGDFILMSSIVCQLGATGFCGIPSHPRVDVFDGLGGYRVGLEAPRFTFCSPNFFFLLHVINLHFPTPVEVPTDSFCNPLQNVHTCDKPCTWKEVACSPKDECGYNCLGSSRLLLASLSLDWIIHIYLHRKT